MYYTTYPSHSTVVTQVCNKIIKLIQYILDFLTDVVLVQIVGRLLQGIGRKRILLREKGDIVLWLLLIAIYAKNTKKEKKKENGIGEFSYS